MIALYPPESNHLLDVAALLGPAVSFLVVRDEREVVGCGALLRDPRGWGEVKRMFVRPDRRGRGIGKRVLAELEAIARSARLPLLRLETGIHNPDALALYRGAGFVDCAPFGDYRPDPLSVFMEKRVNM
jgi:putative acetyltransferase